MNGDFLDHIFSASRSDCPKHRQPGSWKYTLDEAIREAERINNTYNYLDFVPKGRDEDGFYFPMARVRHHDRYVDARLADQA